MDRRQRKCQKWYDGGNVIFYSYASTSILFALSGAARSLCGAVEGRNSGRNETLSNYSYASTSRMVSLAALRAGNTLATAESTSTNASQMPYPM
jgi:hypothetical protein